MQGLHLTADLHDCGTTASSVVLLTDIAVLRTVCLQAVADVGLHAVGELFHRFPPPGGITGVVLLAESHLAVHTWPELGAVTLDVYVCNLDSDNSARARELMRAVSQPFAAKHCQVHQHSRGGLPLSPSGAAPLHTAVTRDTAKRLADCLGVDET